MSADDLRQQLELKLRGELLRDWCRQLSEEDEAVEFDDAWCSGQRVIRFSTRTISALVGEWRGAGDKWGLGKLAFYEIENNPSGLDVSLSVSKRGLSPASHMRIADVLGEFGAAIVSEADDVLVVQTWPLAEGSCSANDAVAAVDEAWHKEIVPFERQLTVQLLGEEATTRVQPKPVITDEEKAKTPIGEVLVEGAELAVISDRFERNKKARELCIAVHGATCAICGFDFGAVYGTSFSGTIDVHHRTPLNEIRENYAVDPVRDLVPVCPNCHRILHSKPGGGVYTVDEVRAMLAQR